VKFACLLGFRSLGKQVALLLAWLAWSQLAWRKFPSGTKPASRASPEGFPWLACFPKGFSSKQASRDFANFSPLSKLSIPTASGL